MSGITGKGKPGGIPDNPRQMKVATKTCVTLPSCGAISMKCSVEPLKLNALTT